MVQAAQNELAEALERHAVAESRLRTTEAELQALCQRAAAELASGEGRAACGAGACTAQAVEADVSLPWLEALLQGDQEAQAAVALLRQKVVAQRELPRSAAGAESEGEDTVMGLADLRELERQSAMARHHWEATESRLKKARQSSSVKSVASSPTSPATPLLGEHGPGSTAHAAAVCFPRSSRRLWEATLRVPRDAAGAGARPARGSGASSRAMPTCGPRPRR